MIPFLHGIKYLFLAIFITLIPSINLNAVFCSVSKYEDTYTNNQIWFFYDVHIDFDSDKIATRFHHYAILEEAKKQTALLIVENSREYIPQEWFLVMAGEAILLIHYLLWFINNPEMRWATSPAALFWGSDLYKTISQWNHVQKNLTKPRGSFKEYFEWVQQHNPSMRIDFFKTSPLAHLAEDAALSDIPVISIEFRNNPQIALLENAIDRASWGLKPAYYIEYLLNLIIRQITKNKRYYSISINDYYVVHDCIVKEIKNYTDGTLLEDFYNECLMEYESSYITQELHALIQEKSSLSFAKAGSYIAKKHGIDFDRLIMDFMLHDTKLLDARIMHHIYNSRSKKTIFVCAGANHIHSILPIISRLGYKEIFTWGKDNIIKQQELGILQDSLMGQIKDLDYLMIDLDEVFQSVHSA